MVHVCYQTNTDPEKILEEKNVRASFWDKSLIAISRSNQTKTRLCACRRARVVVELRLFCAQTPKSKDADRGIRSFAQQLVDRVDNSHDNTTMCEYHRVCAWVSYVPS